MKPRTMVWIQLRVKAARLYAIMRLAREVGCSESRLLRRALGRGLAAIEADVAAGRRRRRR